MTDIFKASPGQAGHIIEAMSKEEVLDLCYRLQRYHGIFNQFISVGVPIFDNAIKTAAVYAERETGKFLYLRINPNFWESLTMVQRLFIIAHECLHIILGHLSRFNNYPNEEALSRAIDIVVNHMCVEKLGFRRYEIDPKMEYCWIETCFKDYSNIERGQSVDYYYMKLMEQAEGGGEGDGEGEGQASGMGGKVLDDHMPLDADAQKEFMDKMDKSLSDDDKEYLQKMAGDSSDYKWTIIRVPVVKKRKWETVIRKWSVKAAGFNEKPREQWARLNRRGALIKSKMFIPSDMEVHERAKEKKKIKVFFYLDTSGSCHHLAERFFTAAKSLPSDKFEIRLFCFHTAVNETDIAGERIVKGGGTRFDIMEANIQTLIKKEGIDYPKAVFVITDGEGNAVAPEFPERWHWFLSHPVKQYIPKGSMIYDLADYE